MAIDIFLFMFNNISLTFVSKKLIKRTLTLVSNKHKKHNTNPQKNLKFKPQKLSFSML